MNQSDEHSNSEVTTEQREELNSVAAQVRELLDAAKALTSMGRLQKLSDAESLLDNFLDEYPENLDAKLIRADVRSAQTHANVTSQWKNVQSVQGTEVHLDKNEAPFCKGAFSN